jgi:hypothetical protein
MLGTLAPADLPKPCYRLISNGSAAGPTRCAKPHLRLGVALTAVAPRKGRDLDQQRCRGPTHLQRLANLVDRGNQTCKTITDLPWRLLPPTPDFCGFVVAEHRRWSRAVLESNATSRSAHLMAVHRTSTLLAGLPGDAEGYPDLLFGRRTNGRASKVHAAEASAQFGAAYIQRTW